MIRIIIVDDHGLFRDGLSSMIAKNGDLVIAGEAENAVDALTLMAGDGWDLALLDVSLPDMSGLEVLRRVRASGCLRPVLVVTRHQDFHLARRLLQSGANGYIDKTRMGDELLRAIRLVSQGGLYLTDDLRDRLATNLGQPEVKERLHDRLSAQEYTILIQIARGMTVSRIAEDLRLSPSTVTTYRRRIKDKLGIQGSTADLVRYAMENALLM
ncbi:MAG: response regulator transcription factor [Magnetococcales bacterium]|nr:response regulator transcription factor [Magnetococcales bacterium]